MYPAMPTLRLSFWPAATSTCSGFQMKLTAVLGSGGTVMARTPSRGAIGGVFWAVPPWAGLAGSWPPLAWTAAAAAAWLAGACRRAETAQPTVLARATTSTATTSHGRRCLDMGPRWGARADLEGNSPGRPEIPTTSPSPATRPAVHFDKYATIAPVGR